MSFQSALNVIRDVVKAQPDAIVVNEGANTLDFARSIVDMYEPRKRLDVGTWGIMGIGMGFAVAAAVDDRQAGDRDRGRQRVRLLAAWRSRRSAATTCRSASIVFNNNGVYKGTDANPRGGDVAPTVFVKGARYDKLMEAFGGVGVHATTARRAAEGPGRGGRVGQADADQRRDRRDRRHRERPHHQPQSRQRGEEEVTAVDTIPQGTHE